MENRSQYDELLTKYLMNDLSSSRTTEVSEWIASSEENRLYFEQFKAVWNLTAAARSINSIDVHQEWNYHKRVIEGGEIIRKLQEYTLDVHPVNTSGKDKKIKRLWVLSAVAILLLLLTGACLYFYYGF